MSETVNQVENTATEERTFTQAEVDQIVGDRLARERKKYSDMSDYDELKAKAQKLDELEEASKTELQKATEKANALQAELDAMKKAGEIRNIRDKVSEETGVPASLLTADTEEGCNEQAKAILSFAQPSGYPVVKDGGEVTHINKGNPQESFSEWFKNVQK